MNESQNPIIDVRAVSNWFGSVVAVNDVSFQVRPGMTGLLGTHDCGKSRISRMIRGKAACAGGGDYEPLLADALEEIHARTPEKEARLAAMEKEAAAGAEPPGYHAQRRWIGELPDREET